MKFQSNKVRWIGLGIVYGIFIFFSIYRYQQVNQLFENYSINEVDMHVADPVTIEDVTYEFGTPMISEDEEKFTYENSCDNNERQSSTSRRRL